MHSRAGAALMYESLWTHRAACRRIDAVQRMNPFGHVVLQSMGPLDRTSPPFRRRRAVVLAGARTMHSRAGAALM